MTIHVRTWDQSKFLLPGRKFHSYQDEGEFDDISGLYPDDRGERLRRGPAWSGHVPWPTAAGTFEGFGSCTAVVLHADANHYVFLGKLTNPANHLASVHWDRDTEAVNKYVDMVTDLGAYTPTTGYNQRDILYLGDTLYLISTAYDAYWGADLDAQPTTSQAGTFKVLAAYGDKVFLAEANGTLYRLNSAGTTFSAFYAPATCLQTLALFPYRDFLCLIGRLGDGTLGVYRLPDVSPVTTHQLGTVQGATVRFPSRGSPFAQIDDKVYLLTGWHNPINPAGTNMYLHAFDGHRVSYQARLALSPESSCVALSLIPWHNRLLCAYCTALSTTHPVKILVGDRFTTLTAAAAVLDSESAFWGVGGDLVITGEDGAGNDGFYYTKGLSDGYVTTSCLDMGHPGRLKTLHSITAHLNDQATDFFVKLWYRVDDAAGWTQAGGAQEETIRPTAEDLDVAFYLLQVKVEIDDDTGDHEDIAIEKISVTYSVDLG